MSDKGFHDQDKAFQDQAWFAFGKKLSEWFQGDQQRSAEHKNGWSVALSGGGIRSAAFSGGVLRALLHEKGNTPDFVSCVSGGGYVGSAFVNWCRNTGAYSPVTLHKSTNDEKEKEEKKPTKKGAEETAGQKNTVKKEAGWVTDLYEQAIQHSSYMLDFHGDWKFQASNILRVIRLFLEWLIIGVIVLFAPAVPVAEALYYLGHSQIEEDQPLFSAAVAGVVITTVLLWIISKLGLFKRHWEHLLLILLFHSTSMSFLFITTVVIQAVRGTAWVFQISLLIGTAAFMLVGGSEKAKYPLFILCLSVYSRFIEYRLFTSPNCSVDDNTCFNLWGSVYYSFNADVWNYMLIASGVAIVMYPVLGPHRHKLFHLWYKDRLTRSFYHADERDIHHASEREMYLNKERELQRKADARADPKEVQEERALIPQPGVSNPKYIACITSNYWVLERTGDDPNPIEDPNPAVSCISVHFDEDRNNGASAANANTDEKLQDDEEEHLAMSRHARRYVSVLESNLAELEQAPQPRNRKKGSKRIIGVDTEKAVDKSGTSRPILWQEGRPVALKMERNEAMAISASAVSYGMGTNPAHLISANFGVAGFTLGSWWLPRDDVHHRWGCTGSLTPKLLQIFIGLLVGILIMVGKDNAFTVAALAIAAFFSVIAPFAHARFFEWADGNAEKASSDAPNPSNPHRKSLAIATFMRNFTYTMPFNSVLADLLSINHVGRQDEAVALTLSDGGHYENLGLLPLLAKRCPEIHVTDGGLDLKGDCSDLIRALDLARRFLNCQFMVEADTLTALQRQRLHRHFPSWNENHLEHQTVREYTDVETAIIKYFVHAKDETRFTFKVQYYGGQDKGTITYYKPRVLEMKQEDTDKVIKWIGGHFTKRDVDPNEPVQDAEDVVTGKEESFYDPKYLANSGGLCCDTCMRKAVCRYCCDDCNAMTGVCGSFPNHNTGLQFMPPSLYHLYHWNGLLAVSRKDAGLPIPEPTPEELEEERRARGWTVGVGIQYALALCSVAVVAWLIFLLVNLFRVVNLAMDTSTISLGVGTRVLLLVLLVFLYFAGERLAVHPNRRPWAWWGAAVLVFAVVIALSVPYSMRVVEMHSQIDPLMNNVNASNALGERIIGNIVQTRIVNGEEQTATSTLFRDFERLRGCCNFGTLLTGCQPASKPNCRGQFLDVIHAYLVNELVFTAIADVLLLALFFPVVWLVLLPKDEPEDEEIVV